AHRSGPEEGQLRLRSGRPHVRHEVLGRRQVTTPLPRSLLPILVAVHAIAFACSTAPPQEPVVAVPGTSPSPTLIVTAPSAAPTSGDPSESPGTIRWETSKDAAQARARARGRPLLVFVFAAWSAPALQMDRVTWTDPRVIEQLRSFVALR